MDASGYTGVDIDQARQTTAYKIIDGLANCGKELERLGINLNLKVGADAGMYHQSGESMNLLLDIIFREDAKYHQQYRTDRDNQAYMDALIAALGDDYQAGNFSDGYTFGSFAHVGAVWMWLGSVVSLGNAFGASLSSAFSGFMGGSGVSTAEGMVFDVGGSVAIAEVYEGEIAVAIAGILAAAGFGGGFSGEVDSKLSEIAKTISENARNDKIKRGKGYHGRLDSDLEQQILSDPDVVKETL